jgi:endonuclease-3
MSKHVETSQARKERAAEIVRILKTSYPDSKIVLNYETPFQLLVATILAAQCTDVRVNMVTPELFRRYPTPQAFLDAPIEELEQAIFSTGFYRNKAKSIKATSAVLVERFGGEVPSTMEDLLTLPGVGRKTANVILGHCFDVPGVVVDTHVKRITNLLGLAGSEDPDKIELELKEDLSRENWVGFSHMIADHGRAICVARRPQCSQCPLAELCPSAFSFEGAAEPAPTKKSSRKSTPATPADAPAKRSSRK